MRQIPPLSVLLALFVPLVHSVVRPARADEPAKPWKALSDRCQKLSNEANYQGALEACERAYELNPDPGLLVYIAQIQTALLRPVQAHDALQRYLRSGPLAEANRQMAETQVRYLETLIAKLVVTAPGPGSEIRVDDQPIDPRALSQGVPLAAGVHRVTIQVEGSTFSRFVPLRGGETTRIELPGSGTLLLSCALPEARFSIDDHEVDAAQASAGVPLSAGTHRIIFEAGVVRFPVQSVLVSPDQRATVVCTPPAATVLPAARPAMNQRGYWVTGAGLSLGIAAVVTGIYNASEYDRWQSANESLRSNRSQLEFARFESQARDNDQLMDSIRTRRKVAIGLGIAGGLVSAGGVALLFHDSAASAPRGSGSWLRKIATGVTFNGASSSGEIAWRGAW